jgi:hypothetical protein
MGTLQNVIDILRKKKRLQFQASSKIMSSEMPEIYNSKGEMFETVYLRDNFLSPNPWKGEKLFFDRYNFGLKKHIYTHRNMLKTDGHPVYKYGAFVEAESIVPEDYKIFSKHKSLSKEFEKIFTWSEDLLNTIPNAVFFPASVPFTHNEDAELYAKKSKLISMICSKKSFTELHKLRIQIARELKSKNICDVFGNLDGGPRFEKKEETLDDYYYQVVVENDIQGYYFTEKILDCFLEFTIPVYIGATKIAEFFNPEGIIQILPEDYDHIPDILSKLDEKYYEDHLEAVKDSYYRTLKYKDINSYLYNEIG